MCSPFQRRARSSRRSTWAALTLTTIFVSKSRPASMSMYVCVVLAKQKGAGMAAPPIWVDRPIERQVVARDAVDDRLRLDLDEFESAESRRVETGPGQFEELLFTHARHYRTYVRLLS